MGTALEDLGIAAPGGSPLQAPPPQPAEQPTEQPIPRPAQIAPHPDSLVGQGKAASLTGGVPPHQEFMAKTYIETPEEKKTAQQQMHQTQEILNKKVGDDTARKAVAPLLEVAKVINGVDISPILPYTGFEGRMRYHGEQLINGSKTLQGLGLKTTDRFRLAQAFHVQQAKLIADAVRQALTTSIRMPYVMHMVMPLTSVDIWKSDPESAIMRFNFMKNYLNDRLKNYTVLANKGIPLNLTELQHMVGSHVVKEEPEKAKQELAQIRAKGTPTAAPVTTDKQKWLEENKKGNPDYTEQELSDIYDKKYGKR